MLELVERRYWILGWSVVIILVLSFIIKLSGCSLDRGGAIWGIVIFATTTTHSREVVLISSLNYVRYCMTPIPLMMMLKFASERFFHLIILGLKGRLQKVIHEFALPILYECSQFLLHLLFLISLMLTHCEDIMAATRGRLLLSNWLDLISAEWKALIQDRVFHHIQRLLTLVRYCTYRSHGCRCWGNDLLTSLHLLIVVIISWHLLRDCLIFVWGKLVYRPAHLLKSNLLLLLFFVLDATLSLVIKLLRLAQLIADHIKVALHCIYQLAHLLLAHLSLTIIIACDRLFNIDKGTILARL